MSNENYEDIEKALADMKMKLVLFRVSNPDATKSELFREVIRNFLELRTTINLADLIKFLEKEGY